MKKVLATLAVALIGAHPAAAQEASGLTGLQTAYDARGWEGVGRVDIHGGGMCTGALIAPRVVLTAAHCLYDVTGKMFEADQFRFAAGWRNGRASAYRDVRRVIAHPEFVYKDPNDLPRVSRDVAVLELDSEIRLANIQPFPTAGRPQKGDPVGVVSYAQDRDQSASYQRLCNVLERLSGSLILDCDVDPGSSGAPVFVIKDGLPHIVSVVSSLTHVRDQKVALGTNLEKPLADLMQLLSERDGVLSQAPSVAAAAAPARGAAPVIRRGLGGGQGAKFVKP